MVNLIFLGNLEKSNGGKLKFLIIIIYFQFFQRKKLKNFENSKRKTFKKKKQKEKKKMRRGITKSLRLSSTFAKRSSTSNIQKVNKNKSNYVRFYASSSSSAIEQSERSSEMLCTLVSPYETFLDGKKVERVNVVTELGERAFLADYVSFLGEIHPGVIEVLMREEGNESTKKYFASSGIVTFLNEGKFNLNFFLNSTLFLFLNL